MLSIRCSSFRGCRRIGRKDSGSHFWFACKNDLQILLCKLLSARPSSWPQSPIKILPSTSGAMGEAQIRTMRMRKAASTRVFWEADL